ncbi:glycosyltransferase family 2 protein [Isoptericola haloaureus]|uniref:Glycosyltransferase family 2 protein n=1 Tax=Isoptericola haloaureus TaxID=1542902 RepID=A0ABU7Z4Y2_9MICO
MTEAGVPAVAVVATVRDEELYLESAVRSILAQDYPGQLHLVVAVGPSHDRTRPIADRLAATDPRVVVVDNPTGSRSEGLNRAMATTSPDVEVVVRIDGHTVFEPTYVRRAVRVMLDAGADGAGGIMRPVGDAPTQMAVARAMSHPAGIGGASFHVGGSAGPSETVYLGAFRRDAVLAVGGFDEGMIRGEDWEMCLRMRRAGSLLWFDPALEVEYRPRRTLRAVAKQFWRTGMWRREIVRRHPATASPRYLAPPLVVLALGAAVVSLLVGLAIGAPVWTLVGAGVVTGYVLGEVSAAAHAATRRPRLSWRAGVRLPAVLATMHLCWGAGFLRGVTRRAAADHRA